MRGRVLSTEVLAHSSTNKIGNDLGVDSDDSDTFDPLAAPRNKSNSWRSFYLDKIRIKKEAEYVDDISSDTEGCNNFAATLLIGSESLASPCPTGKTKEGIYDNLGKDDDQPTIQCLLPNCVGSDEAENENGLGGGETALEDMSTNYIPFRKPEDPDADAGSDDSDTFILHSSRKKSTFRKTFSRMRNYIKKEAESEHVDIASSCHAALSEKDRTSDAVVQDVLSTPSKMVSDDDEGDDNLSACMFGGGHKRNLRDRDLSDSSPDKAGNTSIPVSSAENVSRNRDCYQPGSKRIKILVCPDALDSSNLTNYDDTRKYVYFEPEDFERTDIGKFSKEQAVWNEEFEGCFVSRGRNGSSVCGLIQLHGNTIRPFGRVETKHPMQIIILRGEVVVKSIPVTLNSKQELVCQKLTCKVGDWTILPSGVPFSFENHTDSVVELAYSCQDV